MSAAFDEPVLERAWHGACFVEKACSSVAIPGPAITTGKILQRSGVEAVSSAAQGVRLATSVMSTLEHVVAPKNGFDILKMPASVSFLSYYADHGLNKMGIPSRIHDALVTFAFR